MKRLLLAIGICALAASTVFADQRVTLQGVVIRGQQDIDTVLSIDNGSTTTADDALWVQRDDYWNGATLTVFDISSALTDSTRIITDFDAANDSLTFSAFSTAITDSVTLSWPAGHLRALYPSGIIMDSSGVYTTEVYRITPGASIASQHIITNSAALDSIDTRIYIEISIEPSMPNAATAWFRSDSVDVTTVDAAAYNSWGAIQANYIRFVLDPIDAPFRGGTRDSSATHYGRVMSDK